MPTDPSSPAVTDIVYASPPRKAFEAMPSGGGDLLAMVRVTDSVDLHLGKCDSWGLRDWHNRIGDCELLSPGHVTLHLRPDPIECRTLVRYEQRLSPTCGLVHASLVTTSGELDVRVWGDMDRNVLVLEVDDRRSDRGGAEVELSHWRNEGECLVHGEFVVSQEIQTRAVATDLPPGQTDPYLGRGIGIAVGADVPVELRWWGRENASLLLPATGPTRYRVLVACEVTPADPSTELENSSAAYYRGGAWTGSGPIQAAVKTLKAALAIPAAALRARHDLWWAEFWSHSAIRLEGDADAGYLTRLWHLFYYQMAVSSRGPYPCKFNGGPGLMERDLRSWQLCYVWQNDREHLWPLDAANHPEMTVGMWRMYTAMIPYLRRLTRETWGIDGLWLPEVHQPWWALVTPPVPERDPSTIGRAGGLKKDMAAGYTTHILSSGAELALEMLNHARHTGDQGFLREVAYPWLAGACEFHANLAAFGEDALYHFAPANANEMWWKVKDTLNDLAAVRVLFPELITLAKRYGLDAPLAARCREILAHLPELPLGQWRVVKEAGTSRIEIDSAVDVFAPARETLEETASRNQENPECYVIFPWSLTGIGAPDCARATRTWERRGFHNTAGWSQCGVQAARLGLKDRTDKTILDHARRHQAFPYGGWNSPGSMPFRLTDGTRLADCPYLDSAGENATAIQEMLLQSYPLRGSGCAPAALPVPYGEIAGGLIRLCPAVPARWSGTFRLHAMGGFMVDCEFAMGVPTRAHIESERGGPCVVENPWIGAVKLADRRQERTLPATPVLRFDTVAGVVYELQPVDAGAGRC